MVVKEKSQTLKENVFLCYLLNTIALQLSGKRIFKKN